MIKTLSAEQHLRIEEAWTAVRVAQAAARAVMPSCTLAEYDEAWRDIEDKPQEEQDKMEELTFLLISDDTLRTVVSTEREGDLIAVWVESYEGDEVYAGAFPPDTKVLYE
jgi:hypothetical protein